MIKSPVSLFSFWARVARRIELFPNTINASRGADEEIFTGNCRSGHPHIIFGQLVGVQKLKALASLADIGAPVFVEAKDFPLICPRRCSESSGAGKALFPVYRTSGFRVKSGEIAAVE
jgi:hypothetical protein